MVLWLLRYFPPKPELTTDFLSLVEQGQEGRAWHTESDAGVPLIALLWSWPSVRGLSFEQWQAGQWGWRGTSLIWSRVSREVLTVEVVSFVDEWLGAGGVPVGVFSQSPKTVMLQKPVKSSFACDTSLVSLTVAFHPRLGGNRKMSQEEPEFFGIYLKCQASSFTKHF